MRITKVRYLISVRTGEKIPWPLTTKELRLKIEPGRKRVYIIAAACVLFLCVFLAFRFVPGSETRIALSDNAKTNSLESDSGKPSKSWFSFFEGAKKTPEGIPAELEDTKIFQEWKGDLDGMAKRRIIRALVVFSKTLYFLDGAEQRGISYEMLRAFEDSLNASMKTNHLKVHVIFIPVSRDELIPGLLEGRGDIAVANLTITEERSRLVDFSDPMLSDVKEYIVTGPRSPRVNRLEDLSGEEVYVRKSSSYYESLQRLNENLESQNLEPAHIVPVNECLESEDILEMVNAGIYPVTVIDSTIGEHWTGVFGNIRLHRDFPLTTGARIGWAFRKKSPRLRAAVNRFAVNHKDGTAFGNVVIKKYYQNTDWIKDNVNTDGREKYRRSVEVFRKYASKYDFDYLMVTAQAFQESGLDHSARSRAGAVGIMQVLPKTASDPNVNISNIRLLDNNVHAGVKYMRFVMDHYFEGNHMDDLNRNLFAFASYNAGPARVAGLRKQARAMGLDPDVWFGNVEVIAAREIGRETVQYVSNILKYYLAYTQIRSREEARQLAMKQ